MATTKNTKKQSTKAKSKKETAKTQNFLRDEIFILVSLAVCIFLLISHFGIGGKIGDAASDFMFGMFGVIAYIVPILLFVGITFLMSNKGNTQAYIKTGTIFVLFLMFCTLLQLIVTGYDPNYDLKTIYKFSSSEHNDGGIVGGIFVNLLCPAIGVVGTYISYRKVFFGCGEDKRRRDVSYSKGRCNKTS